MGPTPNLADVYVFKKIAATLSFTKAARQIGVSKSAVSKQLSRLEKDLGVILVNRTTRSVSLTEAGRTFDSTTSDFDTAIERAADLVRGADFSPLGTVALSLPSAIGAALMPDLMTQFQPKWPELKLNVQFRDDGVDIVNDSVDLALRITDRLTDSSLISRRLYTTRMVLAASPAYLRKRGTPETPADLADHRCLGLGSAVNSSCSWTFASDGGETKASVRLAFAADNEYSLVLAACLDSGIIYVPELSIASELSRDRLRVIPGFTAPRELGVYALYPHRNAAAKVRVLVDFIQSRLDRMATAERIDAGDASTAEFGLDHALPAEDRPEVAN